MRKKEIKFSSLSFNEIGIEGLILHEYKWDKEVKILTHFINGIEFENWKESEAKKEISKLIGFNKKAKEKVINQLKDKQKSIDIHESQLKLF